MGTATSEVERGRVIRIEGTLDTDRIRGFASLIETEDPSSGVFFHLDLSGVTDLSWQSLGLLVEKIKRARERNVEVTIVSWSEVLRRTANALGAGKILGIETV